MFKVTLYIDNQRVDLFDDESITVISSVQNISDISRVFNDFSQSFSVPASKNNNKIFKHYYNASINNGFDARVRHEARIEINAIPFKKGTIRLEKCKVENNRIKDYRLTFFGLLIDLKDIISDDYLSVLDLTDYDLEYNSDNVVTGLRTGYSSEDYVFPLISTQRQWFYNSNVASVTYTDTLTNIAWNGSGTTHGLNWTSLRPALKVMRIIVSIEEHYGITFSRDFFGNTATEDLYLWLANSDTEDGVNKKTRITDYTNVNVWQPQIGSFDNSTGEYTPTQNGADNIRNIIFQTTSSDGVVYTIQLMNNDTVLEEKSGTGTLKIDRDIPGGLTFGDSIYGRIVTTADKTVDTVSFEIDELSDDEVLNCTKSNVVIDGVEAKITDFIPKIKVMDFLLSIIRMFNLTIVPVSSTEYTIETLDDWYAAGNTYDISKYVDTSEVTVSRPTIYKEISFKYQEPQTILADNFNDTNNVAYGDLETKLSDANGNTLDGEEYEIELDFEQMVYERLYDLDDDSETNIVYGLCLNESLSEVTPEPHVLYIKKVDVSGNPLSIVNDTDNDEQVNTYAFMPSHLDSSGNYSTTFGSELDEHTNTVITNSLFNNYYKDYITDSFSIKRRKYDYSAKLPVWLLNKLKLNDKLIINGDRYIINEMTAEVTTSNVRFELLNDIYGGTSVQASEDIEVVEETPPNNTPKPRPSIPVKSFSISTTGGNTLSEGCALSPNTTRYHRGTESYPSILDRVFTDKNNPSSFFNGGNKYYKITVAGNWVIQINTSGQVVDIYDCTAGGHL